MQLPLPMLLLWPTAVGGTQANEKQTTSQRATQGCKKNQAQLWPIQMRSDLTACTVLLTPIVYHSFCLFGEVIKITQRMHVPVFMLFIASKLICSLFVILVLY